MNKITVYGLTNCGNCKFLTKKLEEHGISHRFVSCEDHSERCDFIEKLTGCYTYPIIDVEALGGPKKSHIIIHLESEYAPKRGEKKLDSLHTGVQVLTLEELLEEVLKYKK